MKSLFTDMEIILDNEIFFIGISEERNRIYIQAAGFLSNADKMLEFLRMQTIAAYKLKPGFTGIANMKHFETLPQQLVNYELDAHFNLISSGLKLIIILLPDNPVSLLQLKSVINSTGITYEFCKTIEEAEAYLNKSN